MTEQLPSVGGHNTLVSLIVVLVALWAYKVSHRIYKAFKLLTALQPEESQETSQVRPAVLHLPGVVHLLHELKVLSRRHLEQVVASSSQLRHAPVTPSTLQLKAHIDCENILLSGSTLSVTVELATGASAKVFAAVNVPFSILEVWPASSVSDTPARTHWWREAVIAALLPCSKRFSGEPPAPETAINAGSRLSPLRALAAAGTPLQQSQRVEVAVSQMASDEAGLIPLAVGVAYGEGMEVSLCKIGLNNRVEVVKQLLLPEGLTICGLYGFEESSAPECMICCDRRVNTVLLPCCHCSLCQICAQNLRDGKCPICRSVYASYVSLPVREPPVEPSRLPQPSQVNASASTPLLS